MRATFLWECLDTITALIWFLPSVSTKVIYLISTLCKSLVIIYALGKFLPCVFSMKHCDMTVLVSKPCYSGCICMASPLYASSNVLKITLYWASMFRLCTLPCSLISVSPHMISLLHILWKYYKDIVSPVCFDTFNFKVELVCYFEMTIHTWN